jgi:hypothetical protein
MAKIDLLAKVKAQAEASKDRTQSESLDAVILDIVAAPSVKTSDGKELEKVRVITKEYGSLWCFKTAVVNALSNYGEGVKAKLTVVPNKYKAADGSEVEGFNLQRVVVQAIDSKVEAAIAKMPAGTALFASAGAL